ncbi:MULTISPECIES: glycoside hydrolase family 17 protein [Bradyrhizobium]|jgi:exo-beta-1,3-glucanase (GH17 family)|uniref:glycoside hydrolase family 17 protein n=1 Tax=Bradyrhizobium TaxID=374 RepID=UPI000489E22F|nr:MULTISPECIES: beta-1,6-glucan synthase [Bradyrhizobium]MCS3449342.1 glucan 1,3-beta-glucosidase [Bradyrhizobium elkanii]MCS3559515.1 glucan 1,3-beta-glucosidase [Bradyrhizobium elkanii]MCW2150639.1 glucan 1,3-beta-glucosidase [Bradyrhizobium elkanii]MCW2359302.1 glucan 1,3-beta-glucosidase [Bradyrhizobium elkanii]MCW2374370.1 glucan 1,3-beta-glucosidase [Bradyrhizobium elkanii]
MEPISLRTPLALLLISLAVIASVWWWLATPITLVRAPIDPAAKLQCVSYTPFRGAQTPLDPTTQIPVEQIEQDLTDLAKVTDCVRTYSIENGLDQVPGVAAKAGLKVMQGIWLSSNRFKNLQQIAIAVRLAKEYPGVVTSLIVGNEVLLRGEMTANDLAGNIRAVKAAAGNLPVTYADVWEYWVKNREIYDAVDFVTIHILPYWEDIPVKAKYAAAHVDDIRKRMAVTFPGKEILIGETGWPSQGRMREGALPSRTNQARVVSEILDLAKREGFRVNLIEAYDQPWKRKLEGTVGGNWGLFDSVKRQVKYPPGVAITNYPDWKLQMAGGMALSVATFLAAWLTLRRRPWTPRPSAWIAVAISATTAGALLGIAGDKMYYESYGVGGWLHWGVLLAAGIAAPLLTAHALIAGRSLPTFLELVGPRDYRGKGVIGAVLAIVLIITTVIAAETALGFTFDPRYRDFPYASLTMAVVPFALLTMLNRPKEGIRPLAESVFAGLLAIAALYTVYNEGTINWQSDWTCVMYLLLAATLWRARAAQNPG